MRLETTWSVEPASPGLVRYLAGRDDVPTTSFEPSRAEGLAALVTEFSRDQIKVFYILRDISQIAASRAGGSGDSERVRSQLRQ